MIEYREMWYKVDTDATEHEKSWRFTTDDFMLALKNYEVAMHDFAHGHGCRSWDTLNLEIARVDENGIREALVYARLYSDDFAEQQQQTGGEMLYSINGE